MWGHDIVMSLGRIISKLLDESFEVITTFLTSPLHTISNIDRQNVRTFMTFYLLITR